MSFARFCDWGGGVVSWVAEGLGRSGVGQITLVDMDVIAESNINRQLPALSSTLGESKVLVVAQRLHDINPDVVVNAIDDFFDCR
ncbi:Molybdopterin-synthase adenylyltransferase [Moraxella lacunata]|uniref:Molybdopterin-synthase adenylyltransferase n=1 Tax=Moraxella lacunata TaxID=477 RepID=A0A378QNQ5_MORLA|nr:Molybdopterin-synthase adenylyltransferase [Moraxella lacunata]